MAEFDAALMSFFAFSCQGMRMVESGTYSGAGVNQRMLSNAVAEINLLSSPMTWRKERVSIADFSRQAYICMSASASKVVYTMRNFS